MDNDSLLILKTLYENRWVDAYQLHASTKIPPTTLYNSLEDLRRDGRVSRSAFRYELTDSGESYLEEILGKELVRPSTDFKLVPGRYQSSEVLIDDVSIIGEIL